MAISIFLLQLGCIKIIRNFPYIFSVMNFSTNIEITREIIDVVQITKLHSYIIIELVNQKISILYIQLII